MTSVDSDTRLNGRVRFRWLVTLGFSAVAVVTALLITQTSDDTWKSILAGVATTALAAAVVDGITLRDRVRQEKPVRQIVGRRIGRLHQILLEIVATVFDDQHAEARDWPTVLRNVPDRPDNFESPANVYPPRSRQRHLSQLLTQLDELVTDLAALTAAGVLSAEVNELDRRIRGSAFISMVRSFVVEPSSRSRHPVVTDAAAELLEQVQLILPAASRAAGKTWKYGNWL